MGNNLFGALSKIFVEAEREPGTCPWCGNPRMNPSENDRGEPILVCYACPGKLSPEETRLVTEQKKSPEPKPPEPMVPAPSVAAEKTAVTRKIRWEN